MLLPFSARTSSHYWYPLIAIPSPPHLPPFFILPFDPPLIPPPSFRQQDAHEFLSELLGRLQIEAEAHIRTLLQRAAFAALASALDHQHQHQHQQVASMPMLMPMRSPCNAPPLSSSSSREPLVSLADDDDTTDDEDEEQDGRRRQSKLLATPIPCASAHKRHNKPQFPPNTSINTGSSSVGSDALTDSGCTISTSSTNTSSGSSGSGYGVSGGAGRGADGTSSGGEGAGEGDGDGAGTGLEATLQRLALSLPLPWALRSLNPSEGHFLSHMRVHIQCAHCGTAKPPITVHILHPYPSIPYLPIPRSVACVPIDPHDPTSDICLIVRFTGRVS